MVWFFKTTNADLYDIYRLVFSPVVTRHAALQLHNNNKEFVWWWGGGFLPIFRLSWAVTIEHIYKENRQFNPVYSYPVQST